MPEAKLVIMKSMDGETNWELVKPENVPEWVKEPEVLGNLMDGEMVHHAEEESGWFVAAKIPTLIEMVTPHLKHSQAALENVQGNG